MVHSDAGWIAARYDRSSRAARGVVKGTEVSLVRELGERYGTPKTVAKWQRHTSVYNAPRGPRDTVLTRRKKR